MAGGIDWFRWHHGSVNDPKFQLVAKKAGASVAEVVAVCASLLEAASMADERGRPNEHDFEAMDCALGIEDGRAATIYGQMTARGLVAKDGSITAWDRRQPRREREDDHSTERVKAFRERQRQSGERNATKRHETPRGEERREEGGNTPPPPHGGSEFPGFAAFWLAWPTGDRKQAKGKCLDAWKKAGAEPQAALVMAHVERMKTSPLWVKDNGQFVPAPLVYLNQRRWEGADDEGEPAAQRSFV